MTPQSVPQLQEKHCKPCEGGVAACSLEEARTQVGQLNRWTLSDDGKRLCKEWKMEDFQSGMRFLNAVAELAEKEGHHPDLCLRNYKEVSIELTTHAIGGLSENDFILAAKIDGIKSNC